MHVSFCLIMDNYLSHAQLFPTCTTSSSIAKEGVKLKSFAAASTKMMILVNLPPSSCAPQQKEAYVSIKINVEALRSRLELCQFSLISILILLKGDKPYALAALKDKLNAI